MCCVSRQTPRRRSPARASISASSAKLQPTHEPCPAVSSSSRRTFGRAPSARQMSPQRARHAIDPVVRRAADGGAGMHDHLRHAERLGAHALVVQRLRRALPDRRRRRREVDEVRRVRRQRQRPRGRRAARRAMRARGSAAIVGASSALAAHCRDERVHSCTASQPSRAARSNTVGSPPATDSCAPRITRRYLRVLWPFLRR